MAQEVLMNDDLVRLVNKTDQIQRGNYDGAAYEVGPKDEIVIRREIARHLVTKTSSLTPDGRSYRLEIVELPVGQRQKAPGEFPQMAKENASLAEENRLLKNELRKVVAEKEALEAELKKGKKKG